MEDIKEVQEGETESFAIRVRPTDNPQNNNRNTAHFFSKGSTSNFVITREGKKLTASVYVRIIKPNQETKNTIDKIRNTMVGKSAEYRLSKMQWQAFAEVLLERSEE